MNSIQGGINSRKSYTRIGLEPRPRGTHSYNSCSKTLISHKICTTASREREEKNPEHIIVWSMAAGLRVDDDHSTSKGWIVAGIDPSNWMSSVSAGWQTKKIKNLTQYMLMTNLYCKYREMYPEHTDKMMDMDIWHYMVVYAVWHLGYCSRERTY